jgi:hypothetical protein
MKKTIIAAALALAAASAFAHNGDQPTSSFGVNGGYGSSVSLSGGSMAESGQYGNGASSQYSTSSGYGVAAGGTAMGAGFTPGLVGAGSISGAFGTSGTYSYSAGQTTGQGYGDSKSGAGVDYSAYGYGNLSGSYSYGSN